MDLEPELAAIEKDLKTGRTDWKTALEQLRQRRGRQPPWKTAAWRADREKVLDDACAQCGSREPPLVLQHLAHPHSFAQNFRRAVGENVWRAFKQRWNDRLAEATTQERYACARCRSLHIKPRKRTGDWKCYKCGAVHERPSIKTIKVPQVRGSEFVRRKDATYEARWNAFLDEFGSRYGAQAVLMCLQESRVYQEFGGVVTFCKRCAFAWDIRGMCLCMRCKTRWHPLHHPLCRWCAAGAGRDRSR